ncbi:serine-rich protein [Fusarium mundagurra]|uniref:Serine-rich protein n=1 Tax=Fusarium mundagurra TaxID=1567541 RepID=A0A8H5Y667_9HYPO|nr:serine-rich protein [Fusarium mundagurra]
MILDHRQLPVVSTLDFAMSTPGQGTQPTGASAPNPSSVDNNSNANPASSPAENSSPAQPATSNPASNNNPSATQTSPSADETQPATNDASQASDNASASETAAPAPTSDNASPSSNDPAPSPTSSSKSTQARPTTEAADASSTDDSNDRQSTTEESEASATEITTSEVLSTIVTVTGSQGPETSIVLVTAVRTQRVTATEASASATSTDDADAIGGSGSGNGGGGLSQKSKVAIGVAVPIAAIAILALLGLFWWKKRKTRRQAEEERRKEVEDYAYNPNADPTIPAVGMADGGYEMREDGSSGYRGWGNTTLGSTGRKASTTLSGGVTGAYSDITSPTRGNMSDGRSGEPLMDGSHSPEGEILGAMGPSAANNRGADVHRGPSNASSSYSAAGRSDASDPMGVPYGAGNGYYDQYSQNPYSDNGPQQAVIRDNPARRNTRIENPSHYPQQSAGISQNF